MSLFDPKQARLVGNEVHFIARANGGAEALQPGDTVDVFADVAGGPLLASVTSLDARNPSRTQEVGPTADRELREYWRNVPVRVELQRVDESEPRHTTTTPGGEHLDDPEETTFTIDAGPLAPVTTRWHLRVTNTSQVPANVTGRLFTGITSESPPARTVNVEARNVLAVMRYRV